MVRMGRGVDVGKANGSRFVWFTLTESDEALKAKLNFPIAFHNFMCSVRWKYPGIMYYCIEHRQGIASVVTGMKRRNIHVVVKTNQKLDKDWLEAQWQKQYCSHTSKVAEIRSARRVGRYVSRYVADKESYVRSWSSRNWVFAGWLAVTKQFKSDYGRYPEAGEIVELVRMGKSGRAECPVVVRTDLERGTKLTCPPHPRGEPCGCEICEWKRKRKRSAWTCRK